MNNRPQFFYKILIGQINARRGLYFLVGKLERVVEIVPWRCMPVLISNLVILLKLNY